MSLEELGKGNEMVSLAEERRVRRAGQGGGVKRGPATAASACGVTCMVGPLGSGRVPSHLWAPVFPAAKIAAW